MAGIARLGSGQSFRNHVDLQQSASDGSYREDMLRSRKEAECDSFLFQNARSHKPALEEMPRTWTGTGPQERDNTSLEAHEAQIWV